MPLLNKLLQLEAICVPNSIQQWSPEPNLSGDKHVGQLTQHKNQPVCGILMNTLTCPETTNTASWKS